MMKFWTGCNERVLKLGNVGSFNKFYWMCLLIFFVHVHSTCQYHSKCDIKCQQQYCDYDPSTNSYYNSSISNTSTAYQGQGCCLGCTLAFNIDHQFYAINKSCTQGSCGKDENGTQLYWNPIKGCQYNCTFSYLKRNNFTGRCEYICT